MDRTKISPDYRALLKALRGVAKAKLYTSARLAKKLGVSEVTVKRWFSGQTCTLGNIFEICEILGISFFDLVSLVKEDEEVDYHLTQEQEIFFSKKPAMFGLFKQLHRGMSLQAIISFWGLSESIFFTALRAIEKQGLIEVQPGNRVRMRVRGHIRYTHRGPLAKTILKPQIGQFLDHVDRVLENDDVCMHTAEVELSDLHIAELVEEIHGLGAKYRARAFRDQSLLPPEKLKSVRWLLAFAPYQTNWRQYPL